MFARRIAVASLVLALSSTARGASDDVTIERANELFQQGDWSAAIEAYRDIAARHPEDGAAWTRLGMSLKHLERYDEAVAVLQRADDVGFSPRQVRYQLACAFALQSRKEKAFSWLNKALQAGYSNPRQMESDAELDNLRVDRRFASFLQRAKKNARPCEYDPKYRQLDFWEGQWNVLDSQGRQVGINIILKALNGCMIFENWTSRSGRAGKSMNYYDPEIGKWRQHWVADSGYVIRYEGEFREGAMHLEGVNVAMNGDKELSRMTLSPLPDGNVRQLIQQSRDGGKTWYTWFTGTYVPRSATRPVEP